MQKKLSTGATLSLSIATSAVRKADGTILAMKDWLAVNCPAYSTLEKKAQKPFRDKYNELKATCHVENKAMAAAIVSHDGFRINRVAVRTSKAGKVSASISVGEKPAGKAAKAQDKLAEAMAEIARLKAAMTKQGASVPAAPQTVDVPAEELATA